MPANKESFIRYLIIDKQLRYGGNASKKELINLVYRRTGFKVSSRTMDNDIENMRSCEFLQFFAPITFNRKENIYTYSNADYSILETNLFNHVYSK